MEGNGPAGVCRREKLGGSWIGEMAATRVSSIDLDRATAAHTRGRGERRSRARQGGARVAVVHGVAALLGRRSMGHRDGPICPALVPLSAHPRGLFLRPYLHPLNFCARVLASVTALVEVPTNFCVT